MRKASFVDKQSSLFILVFYHVILMNDIILKCVVHTRWLTLQMTRLPEMSVIFRFNLLIFY